MLLRRHKINSVRENKPDSIPEDIQQEELYGEEMNYHPKDEEQQAAEIGEKPYTKSGINRMSKAELLKTAKEFGAEDAENMTGEKLKEYLIGIIGL